MLIFKKNQSIKYGLLATGLKDFSVGNSVGVTQYTYCFETGPHILGLAST